VGNVMAKKKVKKIYECKDCTKSRVVEDKLYCLLRTRLGNDGFTPSESAEVSTVEDCKWFKRDRYEVN